MKRKIRRKTDKKLKKTIYYNELLSGHVKNGGIYNHITKYTPKLFLLLCKIIKETRNIEIKWYINSALAYLVIPNDIISEIEHGDTGYIDDIFVRLGLTKAQWKPSMTKQADLAPRAL